LLSLIWLTLMLGSQHRRKKIIHNYRDVTVELPNGNGNGRELGIDLWEKMGMRFQFQMGMGMGWEWEWSLKWERIGPKNVFPHISSLKLGLCSFHNTVAPFLWFLQDKFHQEILTGSPERGPQSRVGRAKSDFSTFVQQYLENGARCDQSYY